MTELFLKALIFLVSAVIFVPLAKRLGLGSVLGYLIAGVVIGPVTGLVGSETESIQHMAEFGVVMMLFLVGLELEPQMLWSMRNKLLGLGGLQLGLTTVAVAAIAVFFGQSITVSITIGLIFSLSSTAIILQTFSEKGLSNTEGGRSAFSVLLFQDIAVIPILAVIPLLAIPELAAQASAGDGSHGPELSLVAGLPGWATALVTVGAIALVLVSGHYLYQPLFRIIAKAGLREIFTATSLMLVIGVAALMSLVGLSPALGAFLAGVVLANSEFRHELESNIEPFKGLLLGLFFITVGAGVNFSLLADEFAVIIGLTLLIILLKFAILFVLAVVFRIRKSDGWLFALSLAQAGEFGFVLLNYSVQNHAMDRDMASLLSIVVALSMFLTPLLFIFYDKVIVPRYTDEQKAGEPDSIDELGTVVIAGTGRFGQIVNRMLLANQVKTVVLDLSVTQIDNMRSIGIKSYFGDATRPDLLHTAGIEQASALVVAIDEQERALELVEYVKFNYPKVKILARAFDRGHSYELQQTGADWVVSETYYSSLEMARHTLITLGVHPFTANNMKRAFVDVEDKFKDELYSSWLSRTEGSRYGESYRKLFLQLEETMGTRIRGDRADRHSSSERNWTPPPKGYADDFDGDGSSAGSDSQPGHE